MKTEIEHAVTFIVETIRNKIPTTSKEDLAKMKSNLTHGLEKKYDNHWYTDKPLKGSAYRCINISIDDHSVDVALRSAAAEIGISESSLICVFPKGLALWVDPGDVSGQMGKGPIFPIYKKIVENKENETTTENTVAATASTPKKHRPMLRPRATCPPFDLPPTQKIVKTSPSTPKTSHSITSKTTSKTIGKLSGTSPEFRSSMTSNSSSYTTNNPSNRPYSEHFPEYDHQKLTRNQLNYARRDSVNYATPEGGYYSPEEAFYDFNQYVSYYDNYAAAYHPNLRQRSGQLYFPC